MKLCFYLLANDNYPNHIENHKISEIKKPHKENTNYQF